MRWVTHENVQIARLASAWLIKRFIDPDANFAFVPRGTEVGAVTEGTPFHMSGADLANRDDRGTFQVIAETYGLAEKDPVLVELGEVVSAADAIHSKVAFRGVPMSEAAPPGGPPESPGLQALLHGSRLVAASDLEAIERAAASLDAIYASLQARRDRAGTQREGR